MIQTSQNYLTLQSRMFWNASILLLFQVPDTTQNWFPILMNISLYRSSFKLDIIYDIVTFIAGSAV